MQISIQGNATVVSRKTSYLPYVLGAIFFVIFIISTVLVYGTKKKLQSQLLTQTPQVTQVLTESPTVLDPTPEATSRKVSIINKASAANVKWKKYVIPEIGLEFSYPTNFNVSKSITLTPEGNTSWWEYNLEGPHEGIFSVLITEGTLNQESWTRLEKDENKSVRHTAKPITLTLFGRNIPSRYRSFGEGFPCDELPSEQSASRIVYGWVENHFWVAGTLFYVTYSFGETKNDCSPKESTLLYPEDIAFAKRIIESIRFVNAPIFTPTPVSTVTMEP